MTQAWGAPSPSAPRPAPVDPVVPAGPAMPLSGEAAPRGLVVRSLELSEPGALVDLLPAAPEPAMTWIRRGEGLVGWGEALRLELPSRIDDGSLADAWRAVASAAVVRDAVGLPGSGLVAFVSAPFDPGSAAGTVLVVPRTIVGRRDGRAWVTHVGAGACLPGAGAPEPATVPVEPPGQVRYADGSLSGPDYQLRVAEAVRRILSGEVDKVVLARDLEARTDRPVDPRYLLRRLTEAYPACWTYALDGLVGATPELLIRSERGLVTSRVLAGTVGRTGHDEQDLARAASLARSSKDLEEHEYAVRSVARALAPHCASMNVPESPFVLHLPNVMHLASDVTGVLRTGSGVDCSVLDLAAALHPSAAVCGTPTERARAIIAELEQMDRDRYAGPVGWVDASGDGELGIALRCARLDATDPRRLRLFAGCGIVADSDPAAELAESTAKLVPMRDALG